MPTHTCCPKCRSGSGNDWRQCRGACPMPGSPHYHPAALFLRSDNDRETTAWTAKRHVAIAGDLAVPAVDLTREDGVRARVELRRGTTLTSRVSFDGPDTRRVLAACLHAAADVIAAITNRVDLPKAVRSRPVDLRDPAMNLSRNSGETWIELTGDDAWLAPAAVFGEAYPQALPVSSLVNKATDGPTAGTAGFAIRMNSMSRERLVVLISDIARSAIEAENAKDCILEICDLLNIQPNGDVSQIQIEPEAQET